MPSENLFHQWRETTAARIGTRDAFNGMHLAVLRQATRQQTEQKLSFIQFETGNFILCELKGRPAELMPFVLPTKDTDILWLCLLFHGKLSLPDGYTASPETLFTFTSGTGGYTLTLADEKQWLLLLGVAGTSKQRLLAELPPLRELDETADRNRQAFPVTFADRRVLEVFAKATQGPFSTPHHIGQLLAKLYWAYTQELQKPRDPGGEESLMLLYYRAVDYIREHYLDEGLNRETVADACNCSVRQLTRAFQGRSVTFNAAIRALRLHKARELLREKSELTVEEIAVMVCFTDAKHLANYYKKQFHRSPREERKTIATRKKGSNNLR